MGVAVPEDDLPGAVSSNAVPANDLPGGITQPQKPADNKKYEGYPISTFAAQAINALTFGLPDYLNKTFSPETYAEGQKYVNANPLAANAGEITGNVAGVAIPTGAGIVKGTQLGGKVAQAALKKFAPDLAQSQFAPLARLYGNAVGASTGGTMGAQIGAGVSEAARQDNPAAGIAPAEMVNQYANQIPGVSPLGGVTGHVVPLGFAALGEAQDMIREKNRQDRIKMQMQYEAAKRVLGAQQ